MSPYLDLPLRTQETVLHTRRRAVELSREQGMDWEHMTETQRLVMIERAEREMRNAWLNVPQERLDYYDSPEKVRELWEGVFPIPDDEGDK